MQRLWYGSSSANVPNTNVHILASYLVRALIVSCVNCVKNATAHAPARFFIAMKLPFRITADRYVRNDVLCYYTSLVEG